MNRILVVAAHPDDEILGCGGFLSILGNSGSEIKTVFMTDGESSRIGNESDIDILNKIDLRRESAKKAAEIMNALPPTFLNYPDNSLDSVALLELVKSIEKVILEFQPDTVITHYSRDLNIDHQKTCDAVLTATRPTPGFCVKTTLFFEVPSSTEWRLDGVNVDFSANFFVDIEKVIKQKEKLFHAYGSEMRNWPHPRSWEAINASHMQRGSIVGLKYAERLKIGRMYYE